VGTTTTTICARSAIGQVAGRPPKSTGSKPIVQNGLPSYVLPESPYPDQTTVSRDPDGTLTRSFSCPEEESRRLPTAWVWSSSAASRRSVAATPSALAPGAVPAHARASVAVAGRLDRAQDAWCAFADSLRRETGAALHRRRSPCVHGADDLLGGDALRMVPVVNRRVCPSWRWIDAARSFRVAAPQYGRGAAGALRGWATHDEHRVSAFRRCDSDRLLLLMRMRVVDASDQLRSALRRRSIVPALRLR
jgi:hypothetical protein